MKALPFKIPRGSKSSIKIDHEELRQFYPTYHTHEEVQLTLIIRGKGIAYIGDRIIEFDRGDIFLLGRQLPHVFKDDQNDNLGVESISVFFLTDFLGDNFLEIPETKMISQLLQDATIGLRIPKKNIDDVAPLIRKFLLLDGFSNILLLLEVLQKISSYKNEFITGNDYRRPKRQVDGQKINDVFNYLTTNYSKDISLANVAEIAHMSPTAFCRYFKQHTRKSYSKFLNEIRVNQACKLLLEKSDSVGQVAFSTGFNNISNFNRQFKKLTGKTPSEYQKITL